MNETLPTTIHQGFQETDPATAPMAAEFRGAGPKAIIAATLGNLLEIYDWVVFGMFAIPISKSFFPNSSELNALLYTFATFWLGFTFRPLGAIVLGSYADRHGRKKALSLTLFLMGVGTAFIVFCPGVEVIGLAAPIIVVIGRLIQGFSAGGEIGGAVAMLIESAPKGKRGYYAAFQQLSQGGGVLLSGLVGFTLSQIFSNNDMHNWGWRIAFAIGLLIIPIGLLIRSSVDETLLFREQKSVPKRAAFFSVVANNKLSLLSAIGVMLFWTITTYVSNYLPTYSVKQLHMSSSASFIGLIAYGATMIIACPFFGRLSDWIGRKIPMLLGSIGILVCAYPMFYYLNTYPTLETLIAVQITIAILLALYASCASAVMGELFPTSVRATGVAVSYALGAMIFGGSTPVIVTGLIAYMKDPMAISYYLAVASFISCVIVLFLKDTRQVDFN